MQHFGDSPGDWAEDVRSGQQKGMSSKRRRAEQSPEVAGGGEARVVSHASARWQAEVVRERKQLVLSQWADRGLRREVESGWADRNSGPERGLSYLAWLSTLNSGSRRGAPRPVQGPRWGVLLPICKAVSSSPAVWCTDVFDVLVWWSPSYALLCAELSLGPALLQIASAAGTTTSGRTR